MNVKLSNSRRNKWKSAIKNGTKVTVKLSLNAGGGSNGETNFPYELILTNTQVSRIR